VVWAINEPLGAVPLAGVLYGGGPAVALRRLKYESRPDLAEPMAHLLRAALQGLDSRGALVVPVPLHPRRLVQRKYNQAALLATVVARETALPFRCDVLHRVRETVPQVGLSHAERWANLAGAFTANPRALTQVRRVWLVDDVSTTGATLEAGRLALLAAGARSVVTVSVARTES